MLLLLAACRREADADLDALGRVAMSLRGVRPSTEERRAFLRGEVTLEALARRWARTPEFEATVRDLHAETLLVRHDVVAHPPPLGPLAGATDGELAASLDEEPLRLIGRIVAEGRPYTEIVTAGTAVADARVARAYGLGHDPDGPEWQEVPWADDRPAAGILASTGLWQRHMSSDTNLQRGRAKLVLEGLLCRSLSGGLGVREPSLAPDAVRDDPACAGCHDVVDPVASAFFGLERYVLRGEIEDGYAGECAEGPCYPLRFWDPGRIADREALGMPAPALLGAPVEGLGGLGRAIAAHPDFATCAARRFAGWFAQGEPRADVEALAERFVASGYDARELAVAAVLEPAFLHGPPLLLRPEQAERLYADLSGHDFDAEAADGWGAVGLATTDEHGLRAVLGGVDGWRSVRPDPGDGPLRELGWRWMAGEAAAALVSSGAEPVPADLPARLRRLHADWLLEEEPDLAPDLALFEAVRARSGPEHAWTVLLTGLLLDDRLVRY